jgi:hypothetical protein
MGIESETGMKASEDLRSRFGKVRSKEDKPGDIEYDRKLSMQGRLKDGGRP